MSQAQKQQSIDKFNVWSDLESHSLNYYLQFVNLKTQKLQKDTVRKAVPLGDKVLKKGGNPDVQKLFFEFEEIIVQKLREAGMLPLLVSDTSSTKPTGNNSGNSTPTAFDQTARNNVFNARRVSELEKENLDLKNEIKMLEARLEDAQKTPARNRETIEVMSELNVLP